MAEPGTTPPPQTRSNSVTPVTMRGGSGVSDSRDSNCRPRAFAVEAGFSAPGGEAERPSSTMVFHWPHEPHWPDHLPWTRPAGLTNIDRTVSGHGTGLQELQAVGQGRREGYVRI